MTGVALLVTAILKILLFCVLLLTAYADTMVTISGDDIWGMGRLVQVENENLPINN